MLGIKAELANMDVREAVLNDVPQLVELRLQLFAELGGLASAELLPDLQEATEVYFTHAFTTGLCKTWLAIADEKVVAAGSMAIFHRLPYPGNLQGHEAYLLNMYTLPAYRGKLAATRILEQMQHYAKAEKFGKVWLHASIDGRNLYERFGFMQNQSVMEWSP
ncbi:MAG: GNAT family N-acetyltransferase [Methylococcaceae bacterium]|jgi:ribosomal protein S18 acetylase RimI-like enzyme